MPGPESDKYTRGVVGVATGSRGVHGSGRAVGRGACAGPVGLVRYAGGAADLVRAAHPPVIVSDKVADAGRVQAWVCGSGLGTDDRALAEVRGGAGRAGAGLPGRRRADAAGRRPHCRTPPTCSGRAKRQLVITPHDRRIRAAGRACRRAATGSRRRSVWRRRCAPTVLLKGDRTVVASPDGTAWVNPTGTPALATGGTGDVLAGLLGSLARRRSGTGQGGDSGRVRTRPRRAGSRPAGRSAARIVAALPRSVRSSAERGWPSARVASRPGSRGWPGDTAGRLGACGRRRSGST